ncbi:MULTISPECIES: OmpA family protein [unclassified Colwellia]|uniref:OmpA family protein n=1 Tax=unclassified Colwellia TaxID=196834 RepID=UPI0015F62FE6|nr:MULTISPECIES: OmpA family protein [unclassified Colwellia]MBA6346945.1 OmpA family protein [Colwellia sp. BRX8-9]MBA6355323.1 OmpA family protein [Colwellia sp. BRX8-3]MBA6361232.1 OmpA family protein [Colwellia sp. BRX8-6]MBA6367356.1 OmpA family protein [Colwellia sp. BRX8-5]MBA6375505.1 OmpA family protein [Colwellia sp. BRX8-2]|tara:strand:+ start:6973 stop:8046 length:1074 start_codon:yes stop_codon:yes gene_type:complete
MKTFNMTLIAALISSPLAAETIDKTWELGVFSDYIKSDTNKENNIDWQQIEAGKSLGIDLQKIINERWDIRLELAKTRYDIENGNDKDYGTRAGIDAIYKVEDSSFYLFTGVKRFNNVKSYNAANVGAGYNLQINDRFSLYSEAAVYRDLDYGQTDQGIKLGVKYTFGDVKKSPVVNKAVVNKPVMETMKSTTPVVKKVMMVDTDNDGVSDNNDRCANTPANVKVDSQGCSLYSEKSVEIKLNVIFENNSSLVKPAMVDDVQRLADFMKEYQNTSVVIEGHSSASGSEEYNLMLSQKRADTIKGLLINKFSIDASRLSAKGFGETQLIAKGTSPADNSVNRRVVAKIETVVKKVITK